MKYSIIIPTHNRPEQLSIRLTELNKTLSGEILIVENNSTKENLIKYKEIELPSNAKIFYKKWPNENPIGNARNFGIGISTSNYMFFLDDDDKINHKFILWLERSNLNKAIYRFKFLRKNEISNPLFKIWRLTKNDIIQPSTYLLNKKFLEKNNIWWEENTISEDSFFASLISKTGVKQRKINVASIYYNEGDFSIIRQEKKQSINRDLKPLKIWIQKDLSKYDTSFIFSLFRYVLWLKKTSFIEGDIEAEKILRIFFVKELLPILNKSDFSGKYKRKYRKYLVHFKI